MSKISRFKKILSLVVAIMMASALLFTGCAKKDADKSADTPKDNGAASSEETLKPYEIVWYTIGTPQKDIPTVMEELSKYTKEKINATVKMTQFDWGQYTDKMQVIVQSGEPFDICFTASWALPYEQMVAKKAFLPLNELMDKYGKGTKETVHPLFLEGNKVDGELYAIPTNKELSPQDRWIFNKNLVDKYNLDVTKVTDLESLEPLLKVIKENEKNMEHILAVDKSAHPLATQQYDNLAGPNIPFVVAMDSTDFKVVDYLAQPSVVQGMKTLHKYYEAGYVRKDAATYEGFDFSKSDSWFVRLGGWLPGADQLWSRSEKAPVVSVPFHEQVYVSNTHVAGSMMAISVTSGDPERAMMFMDMLNTDKFVRNMVDSGIENVHYKMENGRQIDLDKAQDYNMPSFSLGNRYICNLYADDDADQWEQYGKLNDSAKKSPILGFKAKLDPIKKEISAFENIWQEFGPLMCTGTVDIDEVYPKYLAKMKSAGYDKVQTELQAQLDEWVKTSNK